VERTLPKDWSFWNYGYVPLDPEAEKLKLDEADEPQRTKIQLYHQVAGAVNLMGLDVLEVGCGRGGGSNYIKRHLKPRTMVGVDRSKKVLEFCNRKYSVEGLSFKPGDAESLPFENDRFDAVVNIESSHCYGSMEAFFKEVKRVLRPGGYFLYADFRMKHRVDILRDQLRASGLTLIKERNITPNVSKAIRLDNERNMAFLSRLNARWSKISQQMIGVEDSSVYIGFRDETMVYLSFVMRKP
jgi:ubiquinone/menaquinone biosynthesis C-methylase UbiE